MPAIYSPSSAAAVLGITPGAVRKYADLYARHLSSEAGEIPRTFTLADMRVFAYVARCTATGRTHAHIQDDIAAGDAGEFAGFVWSPPLVDTPAEDAAPLVPAAQYQAVRAMLDDAQRREQDAHAQLAAQAEQLRQLEREIGRLEGEVAVLRRPWWSWLIGR